MYSPFATTFLPWCERRLKCLQRLKRATTSYGACGYNLQDRSCLLLEWFNICSTPNNTSATELEEKVCIVFSLLQTVVMLELHSCAWRILRNTHSFWMSHEFAVLMDSSLPLFACLKHWYKHFYFVFRSIHGSSACGCRSSHVCAHSSKLEDLQIIVQMCVCASFQIINDLLDPSSPL